MELVLDLKQAMCALFEVHADSQTVQRVVTPLEYPGSNDKVVVRVRQRGDHVQIDENGEAAMYASMSGGELEGDNISRWAKEAMNHFRIEYTDDEVLRAQVHDARLIAPTLFHIAAAAQQLYALATAHKEREISNFKAELSAVVQEVCSRQGIALRQNAELPIAGGMQADHLLGADDNPLIIIAATSATRLLEAQLIHMQYKLTKQPGFVLAVAEDVKSVGITQFKRANYYTGKTVEFNRHDFGQLLQGQLH